MKHSLVSLFWKCGVCVFAAALFALPLGARAASLSFVQDVISTSAPSAAATHAIRFTLFQSIPAGGTIVITPQSGGVTIPTGFDYTDVDLAVSTGGPFTDRFLAASPSATDDGVSVVTGSAGSVTITLNSTSGIGAGSVVRILLGTNATVGSVGDVSLVNPGTTGSFDIHFRTTDAGAVTIDTGETIIAIVQGVSTTLVNANIPPGRLSGLPSGTIAAGNSSVEISFETDEFAECRYATTPGVAFDSMTGTLTSVGGSLFYSTVAGHQNNTTYTYYARCKDIYNTVNTDDFLITFALDVEPISNTSIKLAGSDGTGGVGPFPGGSSYLYLSSVKISGLGAPQSTVSIVRDGKIAGTVNTGSSGSFEKNITGLERGSYSFLAYAVDRAGRKSASVSSILSLSQGTNSTLSNIVIPPTLALLENAVAVGEPVVARGESVPGSTIELFLIPSGSGSLNTAKKFTTTVAKGLTGVSDGMWEITLPAQEFSRGTYTLRARTVVSSQLVSSVSSAVSLGVGEEPPPDFSDRADVNGDSKTNLIDFSIMLTFWGTDDAFADINGDGTVNLADFSILLFNWTG